MPDISFLDSAQRIREDIIADRRTIHANPEMAYLENDTSAMVAKRLRELGIEVRTGVGGTGVVGLLHGKGPGKTVLLRGDMDALPITERSSEPYVSQNAGVMHACGHDGHTAMLLGAARLLASSADSFAGNIKFMFQPAEEGGFGARKMIEDGLLEDPKVDGAFALHVDGERYVGEIAVVAGSTSAAADRFTITVKGKGGHGARSNLAVDPVIIAAHIVVALQTLVSREVSANEPAVVTVATFDAGTAENIIPDEARIRGTVRTYNPEIRAFLERRIDELSSGIAMAMRATTEFDWRPGYPSMVNHSDGVGIVQRAAARVIGSERVLVKQPMMGAEDFSYVLQKAPGAMFFLGVRDESWDTPRPTHSSSFDMNEDALPIGTAIMAGSALDFLNSA